ncbi:MAG: hypothetical protein HYX51_02475 [Chloroflexi bacterium]|nr:hypothetical protein [Chloroflexota bacterium]
MTLVSELYALQEIDTALDSNTRELEEIVGRLGVDDEHADLLAEIAGQEAKLTVARARSKDLETAIGDLRGKSAPVEEKLYGGTVLIPKELQALQEDLDMLTRRRRELEDQDLVVMEQVEAATAALAAARARLDQLVGARRDEVERLTERRAEIESDRDRLQADRVRRVGRFDPATLARYERLRTMKRGRAVARMERGTCTGCRITLPTTVQQRARSGMQLVYCTSCERILFAG